MAPRDEAPRVAGVRIRPMGDDDLARETAFVEGLSAESLYQRLFSSRRLSPIEIERLAHPDPAHERALVATVGDDERFVGVARYARLEGKHGDEECELAIVVADEWQGRGVGVALMSALLQTARADGLRRMTAFTLTSNTRMRELARRLGFSVHLYAGDGTLTVLEKNLD
jgi:GNAT superfamily N-acetyltransferase